MRTALLFAFALPIALAAGCGHGGDITGIYQTDSDLKNTTGCGPGSPVTGTPFRIQRLELFGTLGFTFELCTAPEPQSCLGLGLLSLAFDEPIANGWSGDAYGATSGGAGCVLSHSISTATLAPGNQLRVEFQHFQGPSQTSTCSSDAARAQAASLPCISDEVILATRVRGPT
jgi:hypothetical protein